MVTGIKLKTDLSAISLIITLMVGTFRLNGLIADYQKGVKS